MSNKTATEIYETAALLDHAASDYLLKSSIAVLALAKRDEARFAENDLVVAYISLSGPATGNDHDGLASVARNARENFNTRCLSPALQLAARLARS